jgi:hypothetical protein
MDPFSVSPKCEALASPYPASGVLKEALALASIWEREAFVRLWLMEGIPYAFRERPFFYESLRVLLAKRLGITEHELTITGSGRIGYSLAPTKFGRVFGAHSDFDVVAVSKPLFENLSADLHRWVDDYGARRVQPQTSKQAAFWDELTTLGPRNVRRGFVDQWKIPAFARYPTAQAASRAMAEARARLARASPALVVKKISARVYRDWDAVAKQSLLNLSSLLDRKATIPTTQG